MEEADCNGINMAELEKNASFDLSDFEPASQYRQRLSDLLDKAFGNSVMGKNGLENEYEEFKSIIYDDINFKKHLEKHFEMYLDSSENDNGFTLMQQAARIPDERFVFGFLSEANVNPNISTEKEERPVLIAARLGNYRVLEEFKRYNTNDASGKKAPVDFAVWTKANEDTVLHLVLTRNTLQEQLIVNEDVIDGNEPKRRKSTKNELRSIIRSKIQDYTRCIDVLVNDANDSHLRELRSIVNRKNKRPGKTALHFAVDSWPQAIVKSLLNLGADVSKTYKNLQPILTQIPVETISDYLNESCMTVQGFEEDTDEEYESNEEDDEEDIQEFRKDIGECSPAFMDTVRDSDVTFNFRFLLPSHSLVEMNNTDYELNQRASVKREDSKDILDPEKLDLVYEDKKRKLDFVKTSIPEMQVLESITDSRRHKSLLTHPVIKSFVHLKWKKISPIYERNLKFNLIFVYCITWYIMINFGGLEFNSRGIGQCSNGLGFENIINDNTDMKEFCEASENHMKSVENRKNFYKKYKLEGFGANENRSWHERSHLDINTIFQKNQSHETDGQKNIRCNYHDGWYIGFAILAIILIILEIIDLVKEFLKIGGHIVRQNKDGNTACLKPALDVPGALLFIVYTLPVLIGSKDLLWLTIFIFIIRSSLIEVVQFITCMIQGNIVRYLKSIDNYTEIAIVVLSFLVVFVSNQKISDPLVFVHSAHVKLLCGTSHLLIDNHNYTTTGIGVGADVTVKRKLSAFLIVLAWGNTLLSLSIHPMFQHLRFYMVMFKRVASRFAILLLFYALFIISFGLGFYIMFHNDVGDSILEIKADEFTAFDSPTTSFFKMLAMFLGEIEFNDAPIGLPAGRKDGFTSELLALIFLASFMFIMVLVLNNLLNGLAVSDTEKIIKDALIHQTEMYIDILSYSDIMLHSYRKLAHFLFSNFPSMRPLLYLFDASSYLLKLIKREVLMEAQEYESNNAFMHFLRRIQALLFWDVSEVQRKNIIMSEAKEIIIDRKKSQIQERLFLRNEKIKEQDFIKKIVKTLNKSQRESTNEEFS